jgi:hypothetical protein
VLKEAVDNILVGKKKFLDIFGDEIKNLLKSNGFAPLNKINKKHACIDIVAVF